MTKNDPVIDRIREVRLRISEEHDHDPQKLVDHYIELEKQNQGRFLDSRKNQDMEKMEALTA